ncbi:MAG: phosphatidate cytidylyltransferase [Thermoguttaceae bacterium]
MLGRRLLIGTGLTLVAAALGGLDHFAPLPGMWLVPLLVLIFVLGTRELLGLLAACGIRPLPGAVYAGNFLVLASPWVALADRTIAQKWVPGSAGGSALLAPGDWVLLAFAAATALLFLGEMARYRQPGTATAGLAGGLLAVAYLGLLLSFAVRLRTEWPGIGPLASLVIVVKVGDSGAYFVGRVWGRRRLATLLSPRKTVEGAFGQLLFALVASWATFQWLVPLLGKTGSGAGPAGPPWWGWIAFGLLVGSSALVGDLAESLLKRDSGKKDSSGWLPGLGGVLDVLDSVLSAAPVVYGCWGLGIVGY